MSGMAIKVQRVFNKDGYKIQKQRRTPALEKYRYCVVGKYSQYIYCTNWYNDGDTAKRELNHWIKQQETVTGGIRNEHGMD